MSSKVKVCHSVKKTRQKTRSRFDQLKQRGQHTVERQNLRKGRAERLEMGVKELMPIVREGTMILVDWGICRIHKVPILAQSQERDSVSGLPHVTIRRLSHGTPLGREINNVLREH